MFEVPEDELLQDEPLSVDLRTFLLDPTATKVLFPKATPLSSVPLDTELASIQDEPLSFDLLKGAFLFILFLVDGQRAQYLPRAVSGDPCTDGGPITNVWLNKNLECITI